LSTHSELEWQRFAAKGILNLQAPLAPLRGLIAGRSVAYDNYEIVVRKSVKLVVLIISKRIESFPGPLASI